MSSGVNLTSWGEGASLTLVGHPSIDVVTIKIPYGVNVLSHQPASQPINQASKLNLILLLDQLRLVRTLAVAVISVDTYPFLAFSNPSSLLEDTENKVSWLHWAN